MSKQWIGKAKPKPMPVVVQRDGPPVLGRVLQVRYLAPLGLLLALFIPLLTNEYGQYVVNLTLINILAAVGFNIVLGYLGQLAFANVAFFGIGAYATGILMSHLQVPFWLALLPAGLAGAMAGFVVSLPALRGTRGLYLAIITLAFGELMRWCYIQAEPLTMGSTGLPVPTATVLGLELQTATQKFYAFLVITALMVLGTWSLLRSRIGRAIVAIRGNELAAASLGIPTARYFIVAFSWSGFVVAIAGGMYAVLIGRVVPISFDLAQLIHQFAMVMVGGLGSIGGSILGAILLTIGPEALRQFPGLEDLVISLLMIVILLFLPRGLISLFTRLAPGATGRLYRK